MSNQARLSSFSEGTSVYIRLTDNTLREYVIGKHNYESSLNGSGRTLLIPLTEDYNDYQTSKSQKNLTYADYKYVDAVPQKISQYLIDNIGTTKFRFTTYNNSQTVEQHPCFLLSSSELGGAGNYIRTGEGDALQASVLSKLSQTMHTRTIYRGTNSDNYYYYTVIKNKEKFSYTTSKYNHYLCFTVPDTMTVSIDTMELNSSSPIVNINLQTRLGTLTSSTQYIDVELNVAKNQSEKAIAVSFFWQKDDDETNAYDISTYVISGETIFKHPFFSNTENKNFSDFLTSAPSNTFFQGDIYVYYADEKRSSIPIKTVYFIRGRESDSTTIGYFGANDVVQSIKRAYIGDAKGIARKVKKIYIGQNDSTAKLIYKAPPENILFNAPSSLTASKRCSILGCARAGVWALFAGGKNVTKNSSGTYDYSGTRLTSVVAYTKDATKFNPSNLGTGSDTGGGVTVAGNAIIAGGWSSSSSLSAAYMWNANLTRSNITDLTKNVGLNGTTKAGLFGIFAGGWRTELFVDQNTNNVCSYDKNGTKIDLLSLDYASRNLSKNAYVDGKGILIDATKSTYHVYDYTLTKQVISFSGVSDSSYQTIATSSSEDYALLYNNVNNTIYLIDKNLTKRKISLQTKKIIKPQAVYFSKPTEFALDGFFLIYGMTKEKETPEYIMIDAKDGTVLGDTSTGSTEYGDEREGVGAVCFQDFSILYNATSGIPTYLTATE